MRILSQGSRCVSRDSNRASLEYKTEALSPESVFWVRSKEEKRERREKKRKQQIKSNSLLLSSSQTSDTLSSLQFTNNYNIPDERTSNK
jgi:hypothetical protein